MAPARTKIVTFKAAAMKSTKILRGNCWTSSIASRRSDAYRCMVGDNIHDPCFAIDAKSVACPIDVAANTGVRIALTDPLPKSNGENGRNAWIMQLAGGVTCGVGTGTVIPDYPFYCTGDMVCAAPASSANTRAVFVRCGRSKDGMTVTGIGQYLVTVMYD